MKLLVTKITYAPTNVAVLANQFHCKYEVQEEKADSITITKNPQLTNDEFSDLAGKLVIAGFNVELLKSSAKLDAVKQTTPMSEDEQKHIGSFFRMLEKRDKKRKQRAKPKSIWHY